MKVRWAIAGTGRIATTMAEEFGQLADIAELVAVGTRNPAAARGFAARFGIEARSYDSLFASDDVDAIYLATPHAFHTELALRSIRSGKATLVEKAFTTSLADTQTVVAAARASGSFVMEAMWTRFLPAYNVLRGLVADGVLGEVRSVQGDLSAYREFDPADRLFNADLGGGALFDLGGYCLHFATDLLGAPDQLHVVGGKLPNGVEGEVGMLLGYGDGRFANLGISFKTYGPGRMAVLGTKAWVEVPPRFHRMDRLVLHRPGQEPELIACPPQGLGYSYEVRHVSECLQLGLGESPVVPLADTLLVQDLLERAWQQLHGARS